MLKNIDCGYLLVIFAAVKNRCILHGHVFVMFSIFQELCLSLDSRNLPFMEVSIIISFKQQTSDLKVVQVIISKLNREMIDRLRQLKCPST